MKRKDIIRKLVEAGRILKEGANHTKVYGADGAYQSAVPRHNEIKENLADAISRQTGVNLREEKK